MNARIQLSAFPHASGRSGEVYRDESLTPRVTDHTVTSVRSVAARDLARRSNVEGEGGR